MDTSETALKKQAEAHQRLGPNGRVTAALSLGDAVRNIRISGLARLHPEASRRELVRLFIAETHGVELK